MKDTVKLTRFITITGMLTAISVVLYTFIEFPILPSYPFLQYDFSDVVAIIGGVYVTPIAGLFIQLLKNLIHFLIKSSTGGIGELANLSTGLLFIVPIILLFKKSKIVAFIVGSASFIIGALILNYFIFLPLWGVPGEARMEMLQYGILPFNIIKATISTTSTFILWRFLLPFKSRISL